MDEKYLENIPLITWKEIQKRVTSKTPFEAISPMATCLIRVRSYEPLMALVAHAGHRVREELLSKMAIDEDTRRYEEDAYVDEFIQDLPIQMIALDSRFEYDLNRQLNQSVYLKPFQSWGKKVWQTPPTKDELQISYQKHDEFHELLHFFVDEFAKMFGRMLVFDVHSYNCRRQNQKTDHLPVFDLGTTAINKVQNGRFIESFAAKLKGVSLPGTQVRVSENEVFKGDGAIPKGMAEKHPESLSLMLEIKKVYMDELSGKVDSAMVNAIRSQFTTVATDLSKEFSAAKAS